MHTIPEQLLSTKEEEIENFQAILIFFEEENTTFSSYYFNNRYSN